MYQPQPSWMGSELYNLLLMSACAHGLVLLTDYSSPELISSWETLTHCFFSSVRFQMCFLSLASFLVTSFSIQTHKSHADTQEVAWVWFAALWLVSITDEANIFRALCSFFTPNFLPAFLVIIISIRLKLNKELPTSGTDAKLRSEWEGNACRAKEWQSIYTFRNMW